MPDHQITEASCQIALAVFWRNIGKFASLAKQDVNNLRHLLPQNLQAEFADSDQQLIDFAEQLAAGNASRMNTSANQPLLTLLEQVRLDDKYPALETLKYVYPTQAMSVASLFPVLKEECPKPNYKALWDDFVTALEKIPSAHRRHLALWLDHFDTLWQVYAHAIPSMAADMSLYDHTRVTAALAVALLRYQQTEPQANLQEKTTKPFLLIQGDFFGIQEFIFASGGETRKRAAKLLRGRSFYVSLLMECAAVKIMEALGLPPTSQVINAAGKFQIVAPNTNTTIEQLQQIQRELNQWFLKYTFGQSGIGLAWLATSSDDFSQANFGNLMKRLFAQLEKAKLRRFDLCANDAPDIFAGFLDSFNNNKGVCAIDGRSPADVPLGDTWISKLAADQIKIGEFLTKYKRLLLTHNDLQHNTLTLSIFGLYINFSKSEEISGKFGPLAREGKLLRVIDFSLPTTKDQPIWNGYARRAINAYIPTVDEKDLQEATWGKYENTDEELEYGEIKTLDQLACDDRKPNEKQNGGVGISALMTLKGDVDNLGVIFQKGLDKSNFAKTAALSRQMNAFFSIWLPHLCQTEYKHTYTVFAGGDDFFLIGPWHSTMKLAQRMQAEFVKYVGQNQDVHFSAGLSISKAGLPINYLAEMAESALDKAKSHNPNNQDKLPKNAVMCFGQGVNWHEFTTLLLCSVPQLAAMHHDFNLSTSYLYDLLHLVNLAEDRTKPENAIWHSRFAYRTFRMLETRRRNGQKLNDSERKRLQAEVSYAIANQGIEKYRGGYRIALFTHLYENRR